jgi:uncharacterized protein YjbI with pentapeptide repeats
MTFCGRTKFYRCDFTKTNLKRTRLQRAKICDCDLRKAIINKTYFDNNDLYHSDLRGLNLKEIELRGTTVEYVKIKKSQESDLLTALRVSRNK